MDSNSRKIFQENFKEIHPPLRPEEALVEANRCLYCYDAPCVKACPTHIEIPRFIKQIASGDLAGSAKTILEANAFGHSCARACPVEVLCEGACVYHDWQEKPISIALLQRRATDEANLVGLEPFEPGPDNGFSVAVVGGGPAGLACASYLRRLGYAVTLFDREKDLGGLNTHGIAEYKMTQKVSADEIKRILALGVTVKKGVEIGRDADPEDLLSGFDAVFLGIGLGETKRLGIPGETLRGVWDALSFIRHVKNRDLKPLGQSECTVIIGGGNTAIDAATQAKRTGAARVVLAYRRAETDMSAYEFERALARTDGVEFLLNAAPLRVLGKKKAEGVEFARTAVKNGKVIELRGSRITVECDRVIKAVGQAKQISVAKTLGLELRPDGRIAVDPRTLRSSHSKVFAGGDAISGGKEVVNAAADGKRAAYGIEKTLRPGAALPPGNEYWVSTIEGRRVAPIPPRSEEMAHA